MIQPKVCLMAQGIVRDAQSNNISVFNIIEAIIAEGFPLFMQQVGFLAILEKTVDEDNIISGRFVVKNNDQVLHEQILEINFQGGPRNRVVINLQGIIIPHPGVITFSLSTPSCTLASYSIEATAVTGAQAEVTSSPQS